MNATGRKPHAIGIRRGLLHAASIPRRRAHIRGEVRSPATQLANDHAGPPDVVELSTTIDPDDLATLAEQRRQSLRGKRGARPKSMAELVIWGPPRHAAPDAWPRERSVEWARESVAWIRRCFPDSPITEASLHMDEGSPHVHVGLFPRYLDRAGEMGYGWKRAERAASARLAGRTPVLNADRQGVRGREAAGADMAALLDSYHMEVGAKYGLGRGERGSGRKHEAVTVDEASRRHAEDRKAALDVQEAELKDKYMAKLAEANDVAQAAFRSLNEREAALDAREAELEQREAEAEATALEAAGSRFDEQARRARAEARLASYRKVADPLVRAERERRERHEASRKAKAAADAIEEEEERRKREREAAAKDGAAKAKAPSFFRRRSKKKTRRRKTGGER